MNPWWPDESGESSEDRRSLLTWRLMGVSLPDSENGTSGTAAYPVGWLGMAPKDRTVTDPVRPCLVQEFRDVGNAMTANPRSWVGQGVGGRHSTEVPQGTTQPRGNGKGGHFDRILT